MPHPDSWLFLPPEVEALVPALMARLTDVDEADPGAVERAERERIETLILEGDIDRWRGFLRSAAATVADYEGDDVEARGVLAAILDDQFILARAVVDLEPADVELRQRLARAAVSGSRGSRT